VTASFQRDKVRRAAIDPNNTVALDTRGYDNAVDAGNATICARTSGPDVAQSPAASLYMRALTSPIQLRESDMNRGSPIHDSSADEVGVDNQSYLFKLSNASNHTNDSILRIFAQLPCADLPSGELVQDTNMLNARQRIYYLRLFWEVFQPLLQIMSDSDLKRLEWYPPPADPTNHATYSVQHALIDSMIALAIQHSLATGLVNRILDTSSEAREPTPDNSWPGFRHFHWCRERMRTNEDVCLDALRAHALMALFFIRGNGFRDAYNLLGITIRKAYIARLHRPPPSHLAEEDRTARMQLWWVLFSLDIQCSLQLGSPVACQPSLIKCPQPSMEALYRYSGVTAPLKDHTSSAYCISMTRLAIVMAEISTYVSNDDLDEAIDLAVVEEFSNTLVITLVGLEAWRDRLPAELRISQHDMDARPTYLDPSEPRPKGLQRQAILLELKYRSAYVMLQRPCIRMLHLTGIVTVVGHIQGAISQSFAIIDIVFEISSQSDIIYGWVEAMQSLWTAALTIIVYVNTVQVLRPCQDQGHREINNVHTPSPLPDFTISQCFHALTRAQLILNAFSLACPGVRTGREVLSSLVEHLQTRCSVSVHMVPSRAKKSANARPDQPNEAGTVLIWDEALSRETLSTLI
jgi:hypothetical protein